MLIDDAIREASRLLATLSSMRIEQATLEEAEHLCLVLQHDPVEHVIPFVMDTLEHIDAHLPGGALAGLVRARLRHLVGMIHALGDPAGETDANGEAVLTRATLAEAASTGTAVTFLSPQQAWAAWKLAVPAERLQRPLSSRIAAVLDMIGHHRGRKDWTICDNGADPTGSMSGGFPKTTFVNLS